VAAGLDVRWAYATGAQTQRVSGSGAGFAFLADTGVEMHLAPLYVNAGLVLLLHDIRSVRDGQGHALFVDGVAGRLGLRVAVGYPF
jgi:hypothetical protein